jgi:hypothetical protein
MVDDLTAAGDNLGTSPRVAEGWVSYEDQILVIDMPWAGEQFMLDDEVTEAIRAFVGPVLCERLGPEVTRATVREVRSELLGVVCRVCQEELDWSHDEWRAWFALR